MYKYRTKVYSIYRSCARTDSQETDSLPLDACLFILKNR